MECKKLVIETDGTSCQTFVFVDGKKIDHVQRISFNAEINDLFPNILIEVMRAKEKHEITKNNKGDVVGSLFKTRKQKVRDDKTMKFVDKEIPLVEALHLEFKR